MLHLLLLSCNPIPTRRLQLPEATTLLDQSIHCDVIFGSPREDCRGTGICKITGTNNLIIFHQKKDCHLTQGVATNRPDNQGITLIFFRSMLCSSLYRHHFWKGILKMEEACVLPEEISKPLGLNFSRILPGEYTVTETSGYFKVEVDCE